MEEFLAAVVGLGVVAASPFVPALRPAAKKVVVVGLAAAASTAAVAASANEHWKDLIAEAQAERDAKAEKKALVEPETITIPAA